MQTIFLISLLGVAAISGHAQVNLLTNGDFESGFISSIGSGYALKNPATSLTDGTPDSYTFASNPNVTGLSAPSLFGPQSGSLMLIAKGGTAATAIWSQGVAVTSGVTYTFYGWLRNAGGSINSPAAITIGLSSAASGTSGAFTVTAAWQQIYFVFTATSTGTATITLRDTQSSTVSGKNDFALDNFFVPEPSTYAAGLFVVGAGFFAWRRQRRVAQAVA